MPELRWPVSTGAAAPLSDARAVRAFVRFAARSGALKVMLRALRPQHGLAHVLHNELGTHLTAVYVKIEPAPVAAPAPFGAGGWVDVLQSVCRLPYLQQLTVECVAPQRMAADAVLAAEPPSKQAALALARALPTAPAINAVALRGVVLKGRAGHALASALPLLRTLQRLHLHRCGFDGSGVRALMHALGACSALDTLEVDLPAKAVACIDSAVAQSVEAPALPPVTAAAVSKFECMLEKLSTLAFGADLEQLERDPLHPYHVPILMPYLAACTSLTRLCMGPMCRDNSMYIAALGSAIGGLTRLQALTFEQLHMGSDGMRYIGDGLSRLHHLSHLCFWRCAMPSHSMGDLINSLRGCTALRTLRLVAVGTVAAAEPLPRLRVSALTGLHTLSLPFNRHAPWLAALLRGSPGSPVQLPLLPPMPTLLSLNLAGSLSTSAAAADLFGRLRHLRQLTALDLRQNRLNEADAAALGSTLRRLTALQLLDVSANRFRDGGIVAIAGGLIPGTGAADGEADGTPALVQLRMAGCGMGAAGACAVLISVRDLHDLRLLVLGLVPRCVLRHDLTGLMVTHPDLIVDCAQD